MEPAFDSGSGYFLLERDLLRTSLDAFSVLGAVPTSSTLSEMADAVFGLRLESLPLG